MLDSLSLTDDAALPAPVARAARMLHSAVRRVCQCTADGALDPSLLRLCAALIEAEVLPQSARWHRRDLSPALVAAWRAVLRAVTPPSPRV